MFRKPFYLFILVVVILTSHFTTVMAGTDTLTVTVRSNGSTFNGAKVYLFNSSWSQVGYGTTSGSGTYTFTGLSAGTFYVQVENTPSQTPSSTEYWGYKSVTVNTGSNSFTFNRYMPIANTSSGSQFVLPSSNILYGNSSSFSIKVYSPVSGGSYSTHVKVILDKSKTSPYDYQFDCSPNPQTVTNSVSTFTCPIGSSYAVGTYYIHYDIWSIDVNTDKVTDQNNWSADSIVIVPNYNLTPSAISVSPTSKLPGGTVNVSYTINNSGSSSTGSFQNQIRLSTDTTINSSDILLTTRTMSSGVAGNGSSTDSVTATIPSGTTPGSYYIGVIADSGGSISEQSESDNTRSTIFSVLSFIDLSVSSISTTPTTLAGGASTSLTFTVTNSGNTASNIIPNEIRLSSNTTIDSSDTLLANSNMSSIAAGASKTNSNVSVTIPAGTAPGSYYLGVITDAGNVNPNEVNENNNTNSVAITIPYGSITATVKNYDGAVRSGAVVELYDTNWNKVASDKTTDASGVATFTNLSPGNYLLQTFYTPTGQTPAAKELWHSTPSSSPLTVGYANVPVTINRSWPILSSGANPVTLPTSLPVNTTSSFQIKVYAPQGGSYTTRVYISLDRDKTSPYDVSESLCSPSSTSVTSTPVSFSCTIPAISTVGTYYLYYRIEGNTSGSTWAPTDQNNWAQSMQVYLPQTDLSVSSISTTPTTLAGGASTSLTFTVTNSGNTASNIIANEIRLSTDTTIDSSDTLLANSNMSSIAAGASKTNSNVSVTIPAGTAPGSYYLGVITDAGNVNPNEVNENNNTNSVAITIPYGSITATVKNYDGAVRSGAVVELYDTNWNKVASDKTTDASGVATFTNLSPGNYLLQTFYTPTGQTPAAKELWHSTPSSSPLTVGYANVPVTINRSWPILSSGANPVTLPTSLPVNTTSSFQIKVYAPQGGSYTTQVWFILDRDKTEPYDVPLTQCSPDFNNDTVTSSGRAFTCNIPPQSNIGNHYLYYVIKGFIHGTEWVDTDQNNWEISTTYEFDSTQKILNVPYYYQYYTNWCSITSLSMLLKYYDVKTKPWEIAATDNFRWTINDGIWGLTFLSASQIENYITEYYPHLTPDRKYFNPKLPGQGWNEILNYIREQIGLNRPIWFYSSKQEHAIVITGFDRDSIYINDPSGAFFHLSAYENHDLSSKRMSYDDFIVNNDGSIYDDITTIVITNQSASQNPQIPTISLGTYAYVENEDYFEGGITFENNINNEPHKLQLQYDGSVNPFLGYKYIPTEANENKEYFPSNPGNYYQESERVGYSATIADYMNIQLNLSPNGINNQSQIELNIYELNSDGTKKNQDSVYSIIDNRDLSSSDITNTPLFYGVEVSQFADKLTPYGFVDNSSGLYLLNVQVKGDLGLLSDEMSIEFSVSDSNYSNITLSDYENLTHDLFVKPGENYDLSFSLENTGTIGNMASIEITQDTRSKNISTIPYKLFIDQNNDEKPDEEISDMASIIFSSFEKKHFILRVSPSSSIPSGFSGNFSLFINTVIGEDPISTGFDLSYSLGSGIYDDGELLINYVDFQSSPWVARNVTNN